MELPVLNLVMRGRAMNTLPPYLRHRLVQRQEVRCGEAVPVLLVLQSRRMKVLRKASSSAAGEGRRISHGNATLAVK